MVEKYSVNKALMGSAERLRKVIDLGAPNIIIFNEYKILETRFNDWCQENDFDPKGDFIPPKSN